TVSSLSIVFVPSSKSATASVSSYPKLPSNPGHPSPVQAVAVLFNCVPYSCLQKFFFCQGRKSINPKKIFLKLSLVSSAQRDVTRCARITKNSTPHGLNGEVSRWENR